MSLRRLNVVLLALGVCLGASLALLLMRDGAAPLDRTQAALTGQQHAEVIRAATAEVQAFLDVDHQHLDEQAEVVIDGATGGFKQQYADELAALKRSATDQRSSADTIVLEVGISDLDASTATVLVAADTAVISRSTGGKPRTVPWRIQLDLVKKGERWLTSDLRVVG